MEIRLRPLPPPESPEPSSAPRPLTLILQWLASAAEPLIGVNAQEITRQFLRSLGRDDTEAIVATENLFHVLRTAPAAYEAFVMLLLSEMLAPRPAAILLARIWHSSHIEPLEGLEVDLFRAARDQAGEVLMDAAGWKLYAALPATTTIYRGSRARKNDRRPSWTLDISVARLFAGVARGDEAGRVLAAEIDKKAVLAVFNLIGEQEAVVEPAALRNLRVVEDGLPRTGHSALDAFAR